MKSGEDRAQKDIQQLKKQRVQYSSRFTTVVVVEGGVLPTVQNVHGSTKSPAENFSVLDSALLGQKVSDEGEKCGGIWRKRWMTRVSQTCPSCLLYELKDILSKIDASVTELALEMEKEASSNLTWRRDTLTGFPSRQRTQVSGLTLDEVG